MAYQLNSLTMCDKKNHKLAVWAITPNGAKLALKIASNLPNIDLHLSARLKESKISSYKFKSLSAAVSETFNKFRGHIFIMSTGIVVRIIAPHIRHKTVDPAVVVVDEMANHSISLVSGHIGGANSLTKQIAEITGAKPVITTATDVNDVPAIDVLASERDLVIENPDAIKGVNMALLTNRKIYLHDPFNLMRDFLPKSCLLFDTDSGKSNRTNWKKFFDNDILGVFIDDVCVDLPPQILILRPRSLVVGMGCNRNTDMQEMKVFLHNILKKFALASGSLRCIATINIKKDELGLIALAKELELPMEFFDKEELKKVKDIETPSAMVEKHIGIKSVCEAAAILSAKMGRLIVPKQSTRNVTVAIAKIPFIL